MFMYLQIISVSECFITHITGIWMLCSMYTLMDLQVTSATKSFIAHITVIWMLPIM